jgi:hypothetical protein
MPGTLTNTGYNGDALRTLYTVFGLGNDVVKDGVAMLLDGIKEKRAIPVLKTDSRPIGVYETTPSGTTTNWTYSERTIEPQVGMIYDTYEPDDFLPLWDEFASIGDDTNLMLNPTLLNAVLELFKDSAGQQLAELFWQGDQTLATSTGLHFHDGIVTRAIADSTVIKPSSSGNITVANAGDIALTVWESTPNKFLKDNDFRQYWSYGDFKKLQQFNTNAKKTNHGVLVDSIEDLLYNQRIVPQIGMPANRIIGAKGGNSTKSNLFMGMYFDLDRQAIRIGRVSENSDSFFIRMNIRMDANYAEGSEIVLYTESAVINP